MMLVEVEGAPVIAVTVRRLLSVLPFLIPASSLAQTVEEKARSCSVCHGEAGIPVEKTTPIIWGQAGGYMYPDGCLQTRNPARSADVRHRSGDGSTGDGGSRGALCREVLAEPAASTATGGNRRAR